MGVQVKQFKRIGPAGGGRNPALEHQFCERNELQILVGRIETSVNTKL